jgi:hypothetical protein
MQPRKEAIRAFVGLSGSPLSAVVEAPIHHRTSAERQKAYRDRKRQKQDAKRVAAAILIKKKLAAGWEPKPIPVTLKDVVGPNVKPEWSMKRGMYMSNAEQGKGLVVTGGYGGDKHGKLDQIAGPSEDSHSPALPVRPEGIGHKVGGSHDAPDKDGSKAGDLGGVFLVKISSAKLESVLDDLAKDCFTHPKLGPDGQYTRDAVFVCKLCGVEIEYIREVRLHIQDHHTAVVNKWVSDEQRTQRKITAAAKKLAEEQLALQGKSRWAEEQRFERELGQNMNFDKPLLRPSAQRHSTQIDHVDV